VRAMLGESWVEKKFKNGMNKAMAIDRVKKGLSGGGNLP
jgi:hypothetical protein